MSREFNYFQNAATGRANFLYHPGGWINYRGKLRGRFYEAWLILCGKQSLHRAWQTGYDQHIQDDSLRRA